MLVRVHGEVEFGFPQGLVRRECAEGRATGQLHGQQIPQPGLHGLACGFARAQEARIPSFGLVQNPVQVRVAEIQPFHDVVEQVAGLRAFLEGETDVVRFRMGPCCFQFGLIPVTGAGTAMAGIAGERGEGRQPPVPFNTPTEFSRGQPFVGDRLRCTAHRLIGAGNRQYAAGPFVMLLPYSGFQRLKTADPQAARQRGRGQLIKRGGQHVDPPFAPGRGHVEKPDAFRCFLFRGQVQLFIRWIQGQVRTVVSGIVVAHQHVPATTALSAIADERQEHDRVLQPFGPVHGHHAHQVAIAFQAEFRVLDGAVRTRLFKPVQQRLGLAVLLAGLLQQLHQVHEVGQAALVPLGFRPRPPLEELQRHAHEARAVPALAQCCNVIQKPGPVTLAVAQFKQLPGAVTEQHGRQRRHQLAVILKVEDPPQSP